MYIVIMKLRFRLRIVDWGGLSFDGMLNQIACLGVVEESLLQNEHDANDTEKKESPAHHHVAVSKDEMAREGQRKGKANDKMKQLFSKNISEQ